MTKENKDNKISLHAGTVLTEPRIIKSGQSV
jgi:hypothetical protein